VSRSPANGNRRKEEAAKRLENQVRDLLKNLGLVVGHGTFNVFAVRAKECGKSGAARESAQGKLKCRRKVCRCGTVLPRRTPVRTSYLTRSWARPA